MCSPKVFLSKEELDKIKEFKNFILNDPEKAFPPKEEELNWGNRKPRLTVKS